MTDEAEARASGSQKDGDHEDLHQDQSQQEGGDPSRAQGEGEDQVRDLVEEGEDQARDLVEEDDTRPQIIKNLTITAKEKLEKKIQKDKAHQTLEIVLEGFLERKSL